MLLLLHGALGDQTQFAPLRPLLATEGRAPESHSAHVQTLDFTGHGARALADASFSVDQFTRDVNDWLAQHPNEPVDLFGFSMGGYVALLTAAAHPHRIRSVFTLGTKLVWSPEVAAEAGKQLDPAQMRAKVPRYADALAARHHATGWERVLSGTHEALHALGDSPLLTRDMLGTIACPVRLALGDRDGTVDITEVRDAMRVLPRGEYEVLPGTPHPFERVPLNRLAWSLTQFRASVAPLARG